MAETFSYSRLDSFKQCPRKYAYRYIEKPQIVKKKTIESYLGTICHETVQQIYKDLRVSKLMSKEEVLALYEASWERKKPPELQIVRDRYSEENYKTTGYKYVEDFYDDKHPFDDGHTIGIEKQLLFDLDENIKILGYIDRLVDHGHGRYEIVDYKTNKDLPSPEELKDNWQLPLYQIGLPKILDDVKEVSCTWYFLAHRKPITLKKNKEALDQIKQMILERIVTIDDTKEFEPKMSALCSWCDPGVKLKYVA